MLPIGEHLDCCFRSIDFFMRNNETNEMYKGRTENDEHNERSSIKSSHIMKVSKTKRYN